MVDVGGKRGASGPGCFHKETAAWLLGRAIARRLRQRYNVSIIAVYPEQVPYFILVQRFPALQISQVEWITFGEAVGGDYQPDGSQGEL